MRAYFFGAGSSFGTLEGWPEQPPTSDRFGVTLSERSPDWQRQYPGLAEVVGTLGGDLSRLGLEPLWASIDYWAKLGAILPQQPNWNPRAMWDLKRVLVEFYGSACERALGRMAMSADYTLGDLLTNQVRPGDVLVSFNYDTLVESLASRCGHRLVLPEQKAARASVVLAKPHGSVSWRMDWRSRRVICGEPDGEPATRSMSEAEVGQEQEPLVLGAVPIKSELVREVQAAYFPDVWNVVTTHWSTVVRAVRDAEALVFVGYGFPREDHYGRFLLREAARTRGSLPPRVEFYEVPPKREQTASAICEALGMLDLEPQFNGQVMPAPI